jgi:hypothetical protein
LSLPLVALFVNWYFEAYSRDCVEV